jgi:hypothetical protein
VRQDAFPVDAHVVILAPLTARAVLSETGAMRAIRGIRVIGLVLFVYGAVMLALLFSPWKDWALDHSIAELVSYSDRRVDNEVSGSVDDPIAYAGSAVVMFAGLWFGFLVPHTMAKHHAAMVEQAGFADPADPAGPRSS